MAQVDEQQQMVLQQPPEDNLPGPSVEYRGTVYNASMGFMREVMPEVNTKNSFGVLHNIVILGANELTLLRGI